MKRTALDLGTNTGWAQRVTPNSPILSGVENFSAGRFSGGGMRFLRFQRWLGEILLPQTGPQAVYFEEVRAHRGTDAAHVYGGMLAVLTAFCEQHRIPYEGLPVGNIKKYATGKGNATKDAMIAAAIELGFDPKDDNEADAIHMLRLAEGGL